MMRRWICSVIFLCGVIASCSKAPQEVSDEFVEVTLELVAPDAASVKSVIGDGTKAVELYYAAFIGGNSIPGFQQKATLESGVCVLNLTLVKNVVYDFVFWAQCPDSESRFYDLSEFYTQGRVKVKYSVSANDDDRDAFFAQRTLDTTVPNPDLSPVYLKRPFAQVNFAASDYDELKYMGLHENLKSGAVIYGLPDILDCKDGSVYSSNEDGTLVDASFLSAAVPSGEDEYVTIDDTKCGYVGMNYVLASDLPDQLFSLTAEFTSGETAWPVPLVENVPLKRNHRTYLYGRFFVDDADLKIKIVPAYEDEDGNPNEDEVVEFPR